MLVVSGIVKLSVPNGEILSTMVIVEAMRTTITYRPGGSMTSSINNAIVKNTIVRNAYVREKKSPITPAIGSAIARIRIDDVNIIVTSFATRYDTKIPKGKSSSP